MSDETMAQFQARRRIELRAYADGDRTAAPPGTAIRPDDPNEAGKSSRWWTKAHLNLTRSLADVDAGRW